MRQIAQRTLFPLFIFFCLLFFHAFSSLAAAETSRGFAIKSPGGETVGYYRNSYALLVGVSNYTNGWPSLESIPGDIDKIKTLLSKQEFQVTTVMDPNGKTLQRSIEDFLDRFGYNSENRLLIYYAGHGHTMDNGNKGYLVPADAPLPHKKPVDFKRTSLDMNQIISWCRQIDARHTLFLFDSCFSGTIFKQRAVPEAPPQINALTSKPVRQFITAGSAGESVPAKSTFTPAFIDGISYGLADLNKDGYITGSELGIHLQSLIPSHTQQTPQYGKIADYELSRGDFIFRIMSEEGERRRSSVPKPKMASLDNQPLRSLGSTDGKQNQTAAQTSVSEAIKLPKIPTLLVHINGDEDLLFPLRAEIEAALFAQKLPNTSSESIPRLREQLSVGDMSVKLYDIQQYVSGDSAQVLLLADIKKSGSTMVEFYGQQTEMYYANFRIKAIDLITGTTIQQPKNGRFKYTHYNVEKNLKNAVSSDLKQIGTGISTYWQKKLSTNK